jgi:hypothetical protein
LSAASADPREAVGPLIAAARDQADAKPKPRGSNTQSTA